MAKWREQTLVCPCEVQFMRNGVKHGVSGWIFDVIGSSMDNLLESVSLPKYSIIIDSNGEAVGLKEYKNTDGFNVFVCEGPISIPKNEILPLISLRFEIIDSEGGTHVYINTNYC